MVRCSKRGRCNGDLNLTRRLSDGRSNQDLIQCPSCYEARCSTCERILHLQDYLWANCCRYCGADLLPVFSRRSPPQGDAMVKLQRPILCRSGNSYMMQRYKDWLPVDAQWPIVDVTTSRLVMPIKAEGHTIYEVPIEFQCRCCRYCFGGYFHYLSWELGDNWRLDPESWAHLVISRDDYLCKRCRTGDGMPGFSLETAIFCKCVGSARFLSKLYPHERRFTGWVVDNPDIPAHTDATVRRYMEKQYRRHNDDKERIAISNRRPRWAQQRAPQRTMMSTEDEEPDYPPIGYLHV